MKVLIKGDVSLEVIGLKSDEMIQEGICEYGVIDVYSVKPIMTKNYLKKHLERQLYCNVRGA